MDYAYVDEYLHQAAMEIVRPEQRDIPQVAFASGAAYDFLISLYVLMRPEKYDLSPAWAKGVRSRLSAESRATHRFFFGADDAPGPGLLHLVPETEAPFGTADLISAVAALGSPRFIAELLTRGHPARAAAARALEALVEGRPLSHTLDIPYREFMAALPAVGRRRVQRLIAEAESLYGAYLALLEDYRHVHFDAEWPQTSKVVARRLRQDQALMSRLQPREVIGRVTGGLTLAPEACQHVTLVPTFYASPFVWIVNRANGVLLLYGARERSDSAEAEALAIDPELAASLKALADDSRLRMLRMLAREPMYGQQLAHRLGLSHATVSHHMAVLRAAGLARTELTEGSKRYSVRREGLQALVDRLSNTFGDLTEDEEAQRRRTAPH